MRCCCSAEFAATALAHRVYIVFVVASGGVAGIVVVGVVGVSVFVVAGLAAAAAAAVDVVDVAVVVDVDVDIDVTVVVVIYYFFVACFNLYQQVQPSLFIHHSACKTRRNKTWCTSNPTTTMSSCCFSAKAVGIA